jgi:hypothetical protein
MIDRQIALAGKQGATICSDGWSSVTNRPLLNILLCVDGHEFFLESVDTSGELKSGQYIADRIAEVMERYEGLAQNVVQVVTDNARNCRLAGEVLVRRYEHMTWTGCAAHSLDLLLQDIGKEIWVKEIIDIGKEIIKFVTLHHSTLALFRKKSAAHTKLELLKPAETRFATNFIALQRLDKCRTALRAMVVDPGYEVWAGKPPQCHAAGKVNQSILDPFFWQEVEELLKVSEPIVKVLRMVDGTMPVMGKVYLKMAELLSAIREMVDLREERRVKLEELVISRWNYMHSPLHAAGYVLDPQFVTRDQHTLDEVMAGFTTVVEKLVTSAEDRTTVLQELDKYTSQRGRFGKEDAIRNASKIPAHQWWKYYGASAPILQDVAIKVLSQISSASSCERNWSTYDFIHSKRGID